MIAASTILIGDLHREARQSLLGRGYVLAYVTGCTWSSGDPETDPFPRGLLSWYFPPALSTLGNKPGKKCEGGGQRNVDDFHVVNFSFQLSALQDLARG